MKYDFSHWTKLPKVVCACCTYNRPILLPQAVECFAQQDYPGEKVLVVLNDQKNIKYNTKKENVVIINLDERYTTLGEKRNACSLAVDGDLLLPWDDDDLFETWRISLSVSRMRNHHYWKGDRIWKHGINVPKYRRPILSNAPSSAIFSVEVFKEVGKYPSLDRGEDGELQERFFMAGYKDVGILKDEETYYIYRCFNTGSYHASSQSREEIQAKEGETRYIEI